MIPVLVNAGGGTAAARGTRVKAEVEAAFAAAGVAVDVRLLRGDAMRQAVAAHRKAPLVVVGGGDGTLGCAASVLAGTDTALGILALGTRNHLARELGVPLDLEGAAALIAARTTRRIDLARVNGRGFVNNASIGLYPLLVRMREAERARRAMPKWVAAIPASLAALRRIRHHRLRLAMPGDDRAIVTPMLFVGNNRYVLDPGKVGQRAALDDGKLSVFAVASRSRLALVGFALRAVAGRADAARDFAAIGDTPSLVVTGASRHVHVALDGEVVRLAMPLKFAIDAGALRVVAPLEGGDTSA